MNRNIITDPAVVFTTNYLNAHVTFQPLAGLRFLFFFFFGMQITK